MMGEAIYALVGNDPDLPFDRDKARKGAVLLAERLIEIAEYLRGIFLALTGGGKKKQGSK
ncbi:MAG: hypothetical protein KF764_02975 [Labilithrix sp.]|nr:hypothetical protein [Labilithrix sp.]